MSRLCFIDTETTGLDPTRHDVWDIGLIVRDPGVPDCEYQWFVRPDLTTADPMALRIGGFYERTETLETLGSWSDHAEVAHALAVLLNGAHLVGAVPSFDANFLDTWLRGFDQAPAWYHHLIDVEAMAVGYLHAQSRRPPKITYPVGSPPEASQQALRAEQAMASSGVEGVVLPVGWTANQWLPPSLSLPWKSDELSRAVGVEPPNDTDRHTALGDARWARDVYDAVTSRLPA